MKIFKKIKAFFTREDEPMELDLVAAEIKEGRAFLHTKGEEPLTYLVRSDDIRITFSEGKTLRDFDVITLLPKKKDPQDPKDQVKPPQDPKADSAKKKAPTPAPSAKPQMPEDPEYNRFRKRTLTVSLYEDEFDRLVTLQKEFGYKRADFILACVESARKTTMEKAHKKIVKDHKELRKEQKEYFSRQAAELQEESPTA